MAIRALIGCGLVLLAGAAGAQAPELSACGWSPPSLLPAEAAPMPVLLSADAQLVAGLERRYPIAAAFIAALAWGEDTSRVFDARAMQIAFRHQPGPGTASAMLAGIGEADLPPHMIELPDLQNVFVDARGDVLPSGDIRLRLLASRETQAGGYYIEGPVDLVLRPTGDHAFAVFGEGQLMAPVMRVATVAKE